MQGMRLSDADLVRLLPLFMRRDEASNGISQGVNQFVRDIDRFSPILRKWDQIRNMTHEQLDEMAWELNVLWYDTAASLETKRRLIENSDKVYSRLGTKWAVEEVVQSYLGDAGVREFWEYGGKPHYFKIYSDNPSITADMEMLFLRVLETVKRKSQWLEAITIELLSSGNAYVGVALHEVSIDTIRIVRYAENMSPPELDATTGAGYFEESMETHSMKGGGA